MNLRRLSALRSSRQKRSNTRRPDRGFGAVEKLENRELMAADVLDFRWALDTGAHEPEIELSTNWARGVAATADGHVYVGDSGSGGTTAVAALTKFAVEGNPLGRKTGSAVWDWTIRPALEGVGASQRIQEVAVDKAGNAYIIGHFAGTVAFGSGTATATTLTSTTADADLYVAKVTAGGATAWVQSLTGSFGGQSTDYGYGIAVHTDTAGAVSVYLTGTLATSGESFNRTEEAIFAKLDGDGNQIWKHLIGTDANVSGMDVAVDTAGDPHFIGGFIGKIDFDPSAATATLSSGSGSYGSSYITKFNSAGNLQWAKAFSNASRDSANAPQGVAVDDSGNVLVTGSFTRSVDFDPSSSTLTLKSMNDTEDIFVAQLNASGNLVWVQAAAGVNNGEEGQAVAVLPDGEILVTGSFSDTVDFDPTAANYNLTPTGSSGSFVSDGFLWRLSPTGSLVSANQTGGSKGDGGSEITVGPGGEVYIVGYFHGPADMNPAADQSFILPDNIEYPGRRGGSLVRLGGSPAIYDAAVASVTVKNVPSTGVVQGTEMQVEVVVANPADLTASFAVELWTDSGTADVSDDALLTTWNVVDLASGGTQALPTTWTPSNGTNTGTLNHRLTAIVTLANDEVSVNDSNLTVVPVLSEQAYIRVSDLDAALYSSKSGWQSAVTIIIRNSAGDTVANASVSGTWSGGVSGTVTGTTDSYGRLTVYSPKAKNTATSITYTVTDVTHSSGVLYKSSANSDPDGDSNGTSITLNKDGTTSTSSLSLSVSSTSLETSDSTQIEEPSEPIAPRGGQSRSDSADSAPAQQTGTLPPPLALARAKAALSQASRRGGHSRLQHELSVDEALRDLLLGG